MRTGPAPSRRTCSPPWSARTRVHEYGGGAFAVHGGVLFFTHDEDQRLYRQDAGRRAGLDHAGAPAPRRSATRTWTCRRTARWSRASANATARRAPENELVVLPADGSAEPTVVASGRDFYAFPGGRPTAAGSRSSSGTSRGCRGTGPSSWSPRSRRTSAAPARLVAGGPRVDLPAGLEPRRRLHLISDRTGWWNLYRQEDDDGEPTNLAPMDAEFGVPMWMFGYSSYGVPPDGRIACLYRQGGVQHLALLDPTTGELLDLDLPFASFEPYLRSSGDRLVVRRGCRDPAPGRRARPVDARDRDGARERSSSSSIRRASPSRGRSSSPSAGGRRAYGYYYPPTNPDVVAPDGERPPLLVRIHGGPTSEVTPSSTSRSSLHEPGVRLRRRELRREHRLRPRLPGVAVRAVGRRRRRGRARRRPLPRRRGSSPTPIGC